MPLDHVPRGHCSNHSIWRFWTVFGEKMGSPWKSKLWFLKLALFSLKTPFSPIFMLNYFKNKNIGHWAIYISRHFS
jgi:hypothetical protein